MNYVYHKNLIDSKIVGDSEYVGLISSGDWFATPTFARSASVVSEVERISDPVVESNQIVKKAIRRVK